MPRAVAKLVPAAHRSTSGLPLPSKTRALAEQLGQLSVSAALGKGSVRAGPEGEGAPRLVMRVLAFVGAG
jgi:hypothetical protein